MSSSNHSSNGASGLITLKSFSELASRPHLARVLDERRRREREQVEAAQRLEDERAMRLARGLPLDHEEDRILSRALDDIRLRHGTALGR